MSGLVALWSPAGKGLTSIGASVCDGFLCFCHVPIRCPGSGAVLDVSIPDLCLLPYFSSHEYRLARNAVFNVLSSPKK